MRTARRRSFRNLTPGNDANGTNRDERNGFSYDLPDQLVMAGECVARRVATQRRWTSRSRRTRRVDRSCRVAPPFAGSGSIPVDLTKELVSRSLFQVDVRPTARASRSSRSPFLVVFIMIIEWPRDDSDGRESHDTSDSARLQVRGAQAELFVAFAHKHEFLAGLLLPLRRHENDVPVCADAQCPAVLANFECVVGASVRDCAVFVRYFVR
jgi:hypothetical protein